MNSSDFKNSSSGKLVKSLSGEWAFVPGPLEPQINIDWKFASLLGTADRKLSELAGLARNLPNPHLLAAPFAQREALLSSRIEGTEATYSDLLNFEVSGETPSQNSDVIEVSNYIRALEFGLKRLQQLPISLRLLRELHNILMQDTRGQQLAPGEFRKSQNHIGPAGCSVRDASYVPPPVMEMESALNDLEKYIHTGSDLPPLVRIALVHYQFEAIHPFLDGNGRIGRLLITLMLCEQQLLPQPLLYLSSFIEMHKREYYRLLREVSTEGNWKEWIEFLLRGIIQQAQDGVARAQQILTFAEEQKTLLRQQRASANLYHLSELIIQSPIITAGYAAQEMQISFNAAQDNIQKLVKLGLLTEISGKMRGRSYASRRMFAILESEAPV